MRRKIILSLILFFLSITSVAFASGKAFLKENPIDLGNLAEGKLYHFSFSVRNDGDTDLTMKVIQSTCGCVKVEAPKKEVVIPVGQEREAQYSIDTTGLDQEVLKYLYVYTSDKIDPVIKVTLRFFVERKKEVLLERFKSWGASTVVVNGLIDGINPCAFTVLVFFMSFLAFVGYRKKQMFVLGAFFILAVFITYLLIGLGLFEFFRRLEAFAFLSNLIYLLTAILALVLGAFSFYDYWVFKKTGNPEKVILKLPEIIKRQIHAVIKDKTDKRSDEGLARGSVLKLAFAALSSGFIVSILESVCTGQLYLPTIVYVLSVEHLRLRALLYLLLYNLMFIMPLSVIFVFALLGMTSEGFAKIAKKHLAKIKFATAIVFLGLGLALLFIIRK